MNLISYHTLTAYIKLEFFALQALCMYKIRVQGYSTYTTLAHKINRALVASGITYYCSNSYFRLFVENLECFTDVQQIDLELPIMNETISAYCVVHVQNNTLLEYASFERAKSVCDAMGLSYCVICKYWIDGQFVYDDRVYTFKASLSMLVVNVLVKIELTCISLLSGREYGSINHSSNPIGKAFFELSYNACKAIGFSYPSQLFGLFPPTI